MVYESKNPIIGSGSNNFENSIVTNCYYLESIGIDPFADVEGKKSIPKTEDKMKTDEFLNLLIGDQTDSLWIRDDHKNGGLPTLNIK